MKDSIIRPISEAEQRKRVGAALRTIRGEFGVTLGQVSRALEVSVVYVSECERGKHKLTQSDLQQWLRAITSA